HEEGVIDLLFTDFDLVCFHCGTGAASILDKLFVEHDDQPHRAGTVSRGVAISSGWIHTHLGSDPNSPAIWFWISGNCSNAALIWLNFAISCCWVTARRSSKSLI